MNLDLLLTLIVLFLAIGYLVLRFRKKPGACGRCSGCTEKSRQSGACPGQDNGTIHAQSPPPDLDVHAEKQSPHDA